MRITPYCHIWGCTGKSDGRMIVIERAFDSSDTILIDQEKFNYVRTHPEELRAVESKNAVKLI